MISKEEQKDILADWKTQKFIVADRTDHGYNNIIIILCDIWYWTEHIDDLIVWCQKHDAKQAGMTVELRTQEQLTMFLLRWG